MKYSNNKIKLTQLEGISNGIGTIFCGCLSTNEPNRKHKKKRVQKKWIKRYGYKYLYGTVCDEIKGVKINQLHMQEPLYWGLSTTKIELDGSGITEPFNPEYKRQIYNGNVLDFKLGDLELIK